MSIEHKRQIVLEFFETFIEQIIMKDLEILNAIKPNDSTGLGGCTIPTAMTVISGSELIGFLLNEKGKTGESKENITHFLNYPNEAFFPANYDANSVDKIFNYRRGMMHHFFPKFKGQFAGICKDETSGDLFITHQIANLTEESLNVTVLVKDFSSAIIKLKSFFQETEQDTVFDTIILGLKDLEYYQEIAATTTQTTINPGTPKNKK